MPRPTLVRFSLVLTLVSALCFGAAPVSAQATATDSPMRALEFRNQKILAATTLGAIAHLFTDEQRAQLQTFSFEQKAEALARMQASLIEGDRRPMYERIAGERAAVVLGEADPPTTGIPVVLMERVDGAWVIVGEAWLNDGVPGSTSAYSVTGPVTDELDGGLVRASALNGVPVLIISDPVMELATDVDSSRVQIPFPPEFLDRCFDVGEVELDTVSTSGEYGSTVRGGYLPASGPEEAFTHDFNGTLTVQSVDGDRFDGSFTMFAASEAAQAVEVSGTITNGLMPCGLY